MSGSDRSIIVITRPGIDFRSTAAGGGAALTADFGVLPPAEPPRRTVARPLRRPLVPPQDPCAACLCLRDGARTEHLVEERGGYKKKKKRNVDEIGGDKAVPCPRQDARFRGALRLPAILIDNRAQKDYRCTGGCYAAYRLLPPVRMSVQQPDGINISTDMEQCRRG